MVKYVGSCERNDSTRLYPDSFRRLQVLSYPGYDTESIAEEVMNIVPSKFSDINAVYILAGTNNITGKRSCSSSKFSVLFTELLSNIEYKFPTAAIFSISNTFLPKAKK